MAFVKFKDRPGDPNRIVLGEGPVPCDVLLLGERPGKEESWYGRPFVGRSGKTMDVWLQAENLWRGGIYVTNLVKQWAEGDARPTPFEIRRDQHYLINEFAKVKPRWVGLVGASAVHSFYPDVLMEWAHGLAFPPSPKLNMVGVEGAVCMYHPAYGLRDADEMPKVRDDFHQFALMVKGKIEPHVREDEYPNPKYEELTDDDIEFIESTLLSGPRGPISIDTEGWWYNAWGLSFCIVPGIAYVIHRDSRRAIKVFGKALLKSKRVVRLHNSLHDIEVLRVLGIEGFPFTDTMILSYHLNLEPQGLKPLARRHCGMLQDDYSEIVAPASERKSFEHIEKVIEWGSLPQTLALFGEKLIPKNTKRQGKRGVRKIVVGGTRVIGATKRVGENVL